MVDRSPHRRPRLDGPLAERSGWAALSAISLLVAWIGFDGHAPVTYGLGLLAAGWCAVNLLATWIDLPRALCLGAAVLVTVVGVGIPYQRAARPSGLDGPMGQRLDVSDLTGAAPAGPGRTLLSHKQGWTLLQADGTATDLGPGQRHGTAHVSDGLTAVITETRVQPTSASQTVESVELRAFDRDGRAMWRRIVRRPTRPGSVVAAYADGTVALASCKDDDCTLQAVRPDGTDAWTADVPPSVYLARLPRVGGYEYQLPGFVAGIREFTYGEAEDRRLFLVSAEGTVRDVAMAHDGGGLAVDDGLAVVLGVNPDGGGCAISAFDETGETKAGPTAAPCPHRSRPTISAGAAYWSTLDSYQRWDMAADTVEDLPAVGLPMPYGPGFADFQGGVLRLDPNDDGTARRVLSGVEDFSVSHDTLAASYERPRGRNPFEQDLGEIAVIDTATGHTCATWRSTSSRYLVRALPGCRAAVFLEYDDDPFILGPPPP